MSALSKMKNKSFVDRTMIEKAIVACWEDTNYSAFAAQAAEDVLKMEKRIAELESQVKICACGHALLQHSEDGVCLHVENVMSRGKPFIKFCDCQIFEKKPHKQ